MRPLDLPMHVGVFGSSLPQHFGGVHTLETDLFHALFSEKLSTRHQFTAMVKSSLRTDKLPYPTLVLRRGLVNRLRQGSQRVLRDVARRLGILNASRPPSWF